MMLRKALSAMLVLAPVVMIGGCAGDDSGPILKDVKSIIFIQRTARNEMGNVFDYTGYQGGGRIVKLEPPAANGKLTVLTSDPMFDNADFMAWDLSFACCAAPITACTRNAATARSTWINSAASVPLGKLT